MFQLPGRLTSDTNLNEATQNMLEHTFIFHVFMCLQIFNLVNSRIMNKKVSALSGILSNITFLVYLLVSIGIQGLLVYFGGLYNMYPLNFK